MAQITGYRTQNRELTLVQGLASAARVTDGTPTVAATLIQMISSAYNIDYPFT